MPPRSVRLTAIAVLALAFAQIASCRSNSCSWHCTCACTYGERVEGTWYFVCGRGADKLITPVPGALIEDDARQWAATLCADCGHGIAVPAPPCEDGPDAGEEEWLFQCGRAGESRVYAIRRDEAGGDHERARAIVQIRVLLNRAEERREAGR